MSREECLVNYLIILIKYNPADVQYDVSDNIESNISSIAVDTTGAAEELRTASDYQRKAGRRAACLMIIIAIVVCIVLLAVSRLVLPFCSLKRRSDVCI